MNTDLHPRRYIREYAAFSAWRSIQHFPDFLVKRWQEYHLKKVFAVARTHVAFYKEHYNGYIKKISLPALECLPIVSRADLKKAGFENTYVHDLPAWAYRVAGSTSGSTGEPLQFYCTPFGGPYKKIERMYSYHKSWRFLLRRGYALKQLLEETKMVHLRCVRTSSDPLHLSFSADDLYTNPKDLFSSVYHFGGTVFASYASYVIDFCRMLEETEFAGKITFPFTTTTGEVLYPDQRAYIERVLNTTVIERFGMEEFYWTMAIEEKQSEGLVGYAESYLFEVVDERGSSCKENEVGRLVVTDLTNTVMPLIRYETGDLALLLKKRGTYVRFRVLGRDRYLSFGKHKITHFHLNSVLSKYAKALVQYQFIKHSDQRLEVMLVTHTRASQSLETELTELLKKTLGTHVEIAYTYTDHIERTSVGKTRVFVDMTKAQNIYS